MDAQQYPGINLTPVSNFAFEFLFLFLRFSNIGRFVAGKVSVAQDGTPQKKGCP